MHSTEAQLATKTPVTQKHSAASLVSRDVAAWVDVAVNFIPWPEYTLRRKTITAATGQSERTSLGNRLPRVRNIVVVNVGSATAAEIWWRCELDLPPPGNLQVATVTMGCLHWLMKTSLLPLLPQVDPIRWCVQPYLSPYTCASWPLTPTWPQLPLAD